MTDGWRGWLRYLSHRRGAAIVEEPAIGPLERDGSRKTLFVIRRLGDVPEDPFRCLRPWRPSLQSGVWGLARPGVRREVDVQPAPTVGVHVRLTDYRDNVWLTPMDFFVQIIMGIRRIAAAELPVTVFSDGSDTELRDLLSLPGVSRAPGQSDFADLLLLSRSRILVTSRASTFSNWAAFLGDGVVLRHEAYGVVANRGEDWDRRVFEGWPGDDPADWPALLQENIRDVRAGRWRTDWWTEVCAGAAGNR